MIIWMRRNKLNSDSQKKKAKNNVEKITRNNR